MTTSVLKAGMKRPSLQRLTLSRPMNQSGEGTIFVITDIWEIIVETMILISHRQTMLWLASTKTLVEVFPTPWTIGGAKMASKKLRLLDAWSRAWSGQSLKPQYDEFLFWLGKRVFYSWIFSWLWAISLFSAMITINWPQSFPSPQTAERPRQPRSQVRRERRTHGGNILGF